MDKKRIRRQAKIELSKRSFWDYCKATYPEFYKESRPHLNLLCDTLQNVYEGYGPKRLMINMPPRHGKSFTLVNFCQWLLGKSHDNRVITVSYNETLSSRFSKGVRDSIETVNLDEDKITFQDIFPYTKIKRGDASMSMWSLEGQYFNYLGTGMGGTITGIGCNVGIIDDPIKNDKEAFNDRVLDDHWKFYTDTFLSRLEQGAIQVVNMTRWSTDDLCGKLLDSEGNEWEVLKMSAYNKETDEMLCEELLSKKDYLDKQKKTSPAIFGANYKQEPVDEVGRMYKRFNTYKTLPEQGEYHNYTDTADEGKDYLCSINYQVYDNKIYIIDVLFTKESMEFTEPALTKMLTKDDIQRTIIESNNGGAGFARNVKKLLKAKGNNFTVVRQYFQKNNKKSRIFSNAYWIEENVYYPMNWGQLWPEFYDSMKRYKREGTNTHDDAQDCLTGCAEQVNRVKLTFD